MMLKGVLFILLSCFVYAQVQITDCGLLDQPNTEYILMNDVDYDGTCFGIKGNGITLNLNGHTITFGNPSSDMWSHAVVSHSGYAGERPSSWNGGGDNIVVKNGNIIQKNINTKLPERGSGTAAHAIYFRSNNNIEFYDLTITSNAVNDATILRLRGVSNAHVHDVTINNNVQDIMDRHYPGQSSIWIEGGSGNYEVNDVIINGGPHRGIVVSGDFSSCDVHDNTISHNQRYVNGYAFSISGSNINVHDNVVAPIEGRGVHMTGHDNEFHHNYLDLTLGQVIDHNAGQTNYHDIFTNVHGIKFEGSDSTNNRIYSNTVIAIQPDSSHAPPTPLNIDARGTDANNEVFNNNFTAITYASSSTGGQGYGAFATYATGLILYRCPGDSGLIHHNIFNSNDVAVMKENYDCDFDIHSNTFNLLPSPTSNHMTIDMNSGTGSFDFYDNEFIGFEPDDASAVDLDMRFHLILKTAIAGETVTIDAQQYTSGSDSLIHIDLPMYEIHGATNVFSPYTVTYNGQDYQIVLDRSKYVDLTDQNEIYKCSGAVTGSCLCGTQIVDTGYCCFDSVSTSACDSFSMSTCTELNGVNCDANSNTCDGGSFIYSIDLGTDCCTGTCTTVAVSCDEADTTAPLGEIGTAELLAFIGLWKTGSVNIEQMMDAIGKWKNGC